MKKWNKLLLTILTTLILSLSCVSADDSGSRYLIGVLYDESSRTINYNVYAKDDAFLNYPARKFRKAYTESKDINLPTEDDEFRDANYDFIKYKLTNNSSTSYSASDGGWVTYISFPGFDNGNEPKPTQRDFNQANEVVGALCNSINEIIYYIEKYSPDAKGFKLNDLGFKIATAVYDVRTSSSSTIDGTGVKVYNATNSNVPSKISENIDKIVKKAEGTYRQGIKKSDFIVIKHDDGDWVALMWNCPKGYTSNTKNKQFLADEHSDSGTNRVSHMSIIGLITLANSTYSGGSTADNGGWKIFDNPGLLSRTINEFIEEKIGGWGVRVLGLSTMEELTYNRGTKAYTYYLGLMPTSWFEVANSLFWFFEIIGVFILLFSVFNLAFKQNYAAISPLVRVNIQDQIANILIAIFLMLLYVPIFYVMAKTNALIVEGLNAFVPEKTLNTAAGTGVILGLIVTIAELVIVIRLNIMYLTRAVTITLLHIIAPAAIASVSLQGTHGNSFFNIWLRELVGSIFIQTFYAIILTLFLLIGSKGGGSKFDGLLFLYMFIPLNSWFKQTFTHSSGVVGVAGDVSQQAKNTWGNVKSAASKIGQAGKRGLDAGASTAMEVSNASGGGRMQSSGGKNSDGSSSVGNKNNDGMQKGKTMGREGSNSNSRKSSSGGGSAVLAGLAAAAGFSNVSSSIRSNAVKKAKEESPQNKKMNQLYEGIMDGKISKSDLKKQLSNSERLEYSSKIESAYKIANENNGISNRESESYTDTEKRISPSESTEVP